MKATKTYRLEDLTEKFNLRKEADLLNEQGFDPMFAEWFAVENYLTARGVAFSSELKAPGVVIFEIEDTDKEEKTMRQYILNIVDMRVNIERPNGDIDFLHYKGGIDTDYPIEGELSLSSILECLNKHIYAGRELTADDLHIEGQEGIFSITEDVDAYPCEEGPYIVDYYFTVKAVEPVELPTE